MKAFICSQFGYFPLLWMFHSRKINNRINSLHKNALRVVYRDYKATFSELLSKNKSVTIHQRNLQLLATEIVKACVRYFLSNFYLSPNDSPSKIMKSFSFHLKSSFRS